MKSNQNIKSASKRLAVIAVMAALLSASKLALAQIPNIETVTTLIIIFGCVFGFDAVFASLIFCSVDIILYGSTPDVIIAYFIYWPLMAFLAALLSKAQIKSLAPYLILAITMTLAFGFLTSFLYMLFYTAKFWAVYGSGLIFYVNQLLSALAFMLMGFIPLTKALRRIKKEMRI